MISNRRTDQETALSNAISQAILDHYGWAPLHVRYAAADLVIEVLRTDRDQAIYPPA